MQSWSKKYRAPRGKAFDAKEIALFGRQILTVCISACHIIAIYAPNVVQGMAFLRDVGFQALGHVHSGNIFISVDTATGSTEGEVCVLGGHELTLLGYRTTLYREIVGKGLLKYIDIIMFGEIINTQPI